MKKKFLWNDTTTICCCYLETSILSHPKTFNSHRISWGELIRQISSLLVAQTVKNLPAMWETQVWSWVRKIPWRREWLPTPVLWPGEFHEQRNLARLQPMGSQRVGHDYTHTHTHTHTHKWEKSQNILSIYLWTQKDWSKLHYIFNSQILEHRIMNDFITTFFYIKIHCLGEVVLKIDRHKNYTAIVIRDMA